MPDTAADPFAGQNYVQMSKSQRFAAFLIILGPETAASILRQLEAAELEAVTLEMSKIPFLTQEFQNEVLREFSSLAVQATLGVCGGMKFVNAALEKGVGAFRASDVMNKVSPANNRPTIPALQNVLDMEPRPLANLLKHESPQAVALVVSYLPPDRASRVLAELPEAQREHVVERLATLAPAPVEAVERLASTLSGPFSKSWYRTACCSAYRTSTPSYSPTPSSSPPPTTSMPLSCISSKYTTALSHSIPRSPHPEQL